MMRIIVTLILCLTVFTTSAQSNVFNNDSSKTAICDTTTFSGRLYNKEYNVYIQMDLYHNNVIVPYQEVYGEIPGYFGDGQDARKWLFTDAEITSPASALITIINDYGSEDLTATLTKKDNNLYILKQLDGSTIKIARNHKWVKMPKTLEFIKQK